MPRPWAEGVAAANAEAKQPILFLPPSSAAPTAWAQWVETFEAAGYATLAPDWPPDQDDGPSRDALARATGYFAEVAQALSSRPAIIGHGLGADVARALAGEGLSAATVAVAPGSAADARPAEAGAATDEDGPLLIIPGGGDAFGPAAAESALSFIQRFV